MTVSQVDSTRNATNIAIWLETGSDGQQSLADLRSRVGTNDFLVGITVGKASVVVRETREDGRLGPAVSLFSATAGKLLPIPSGGDGVRIFLYGTANCKPCYSTLTRIWINRQKSWKQCSKAHSTISRTSPIGWPTYARATTR